MSAIAEAKKLLAAATAESCSWCRGEAPTKPFPMSSFDPDEHEAKCDPKDEAQALMDEKARAILAVLVEAVEALGKDDRHLPVDTTDCKGCKALAAFEALFPADRGEVE